MGRRGKRTIEETAANKAAFLEVYKTSFGKQHALQQIGISSLNTFRNWMKDPHFAEAFKAAHEICVDNAESLLYQAAMGQLELKKNQFLALAMWLNGNLGEKYNPKASYELVHTTAKEKARQMYKDLVDELGRKEDDAQALSGENIQGVELLPHPRAIQDTR
jgi:hypothetical protein